MRARVCIKYYNYTRAVAIASGAVGIPRKTREINNGEKKKSNNIKERKNKTGKEEPYVIVDERIFN